MVENQDLNELESFNRFSKLMDFLFTKLSVPETFKATIIGYLWKNKQLCIELDKEVMKIWSKR